MTERTSTRKMHANIEPTVFDKGLRLTVEVKVYDNGLITCDDQPMNRDNSEAQGYVATNSAIAEKLWILQKAATDRAKQP